MNKTVNELHEIVNDFVSKCSAIPEEEFSFKPLPKKWSKKEVIGHLIDSAQNNLRRFICGQYETTPPKIAYEQDFWVSVNDYQNTSKEDVIEMWRLINERICSVLRAMPLSNYTKEIDTGKANVELHTLQFLAEDYVKHMKHHLNQVIPRSFEVVYP